MNSQSEKELVGLSGWLILVGISIPLSILGSLYELVDRFNFWFPVLTSVLSGEGEMGDIVTRGELVTIVMVGYLYQFVCLIVFSYMCLLFFKKRKSFPRWFITINSLILLYIVLFTFFCLAKFNINIWRLLGVELSIQAVYSALWIPYMVRSKRVRNTFVH